MTNDERKLDKAQKDQTDIGATENDPHSEPASFDDMMNILNYRTILWVDVSNLAETYLDTDTMTLKNYTAQHYAQSRLDSFGITNRREL